MKKILCVVLVFFALGFISRGAASVDEALANNMAPGTWTTNPRYITFGEYNGHNLKWRVLDVYISDGVTSDDNTSGNKTAFLVLDDVLRESEVDGGGAVTMGFDGDSNNFPTSGIFTFLNGDFLINSFSDTERNDILKAKYKPDNGSYTWYQGPAEATSQVFLLSVGETGKTEYFKNNADRDVGYDYWLRSPGYITYYAAVVLSAGQVIGSGYYVFRPEFAVRPALKINLASPVFTPAFVSYPPQKESEPE